MPVMMTIKPKFDHGACLHDCPHLMTVVDYDGYYHRYVCCAYKTVVVVCTDGEKETFDEEIEDALKGHDTMRAIGCVIDFGRVELPASANTFENANSFKEASHDNS